MVAYKVTPALSLGGGVRIAYTRGVLSNAIDYGTLDALPVASGGFGGANGGNPTHDDGIATIEGDDLALGYNLGILYDIAPGTGSVPPTAPSCATGSTARLTSTIAPWATRLRQAPMPSSGPAQRPTSTCRRPSRSASTTRSTHASP